MGASMPRLVKDGKSSIWFFRWTLPQALQKTLHQKSLYLSLGTRDTRLAKCLAGVMNLRVEAMKRIPDLDPSKIRKLLEIDIVRGVFRADTQEEQERGLQILENLGRLRQHAASTTVRTARSVAATTEPQAEKQPRAPLFQAVADELIREVATTLKKVTVDKYRGTFEAFRTFHGNRFVDGYTRTEVKHFKEKLINDGFVPLNRPGN